MKKLTLKQEGSWIVVPATNPSFVRLLQSGITPTSYRKYESHGHRWLVWWERAPELVSLASRYYQVDWSQLPGEWQMLIAGGRKSSTIRRKPKAKASPFSSLYLLDTAPKPVVKAVYKALLREYHPDHNDGVGDKEKLNEVITAYREVISTFDD